MDAASRPTPASASLAGAAWTAPAVSHAPPVFVSALLCRPGAVRLTGCTKLLSQLNPCSLT